MKKSKNPYSYDYDQVEREFGIVFEKSDKISQLGGLAPLIAFLKKGKFRERLRVEFGDERARSMLQLMMGLIAGADRMKGVARVGSDPLVRQFLVNPVGEAQLARDFKAFKKAELERLHEWVIGLAVLELVREIPQSDALIFDIDSTAVEKFGEQEGVEKGYLARDKIEDCYQYLFFRLHNLNTILHGTIRGGAAHSQNGICEYLNRFLPMFKKQWKTIWRADSGYFNEDAIDVFSENDATFFIKAPMIETRVGMAAHSPDLAWIVLDLEQPHIQYASSITRTKKGTIWREIFKRERKEKQQLSLLDATEYEYAALATNDLVIGEREAFAFYNGRAHVETNIKEFKNDYALGKVVTESFDANDAITQVTILAYILMAHFKRLLLPKDKMKSQLKTLRWQVFNIPGKLLSGARRKLVKIHNIFVDEKFYSRLLFRLKYLRSWVLEPPNFSQQAA